MIRRSVSQLAGPPRIFTTSRSCLRTNAWPLLQLQSSSQQARYASSKTTPTSRVFNFFYGTTLIVGLGIVYIYATDTRASIHKWVVIPALRTIYPDAEDAHHIGNQTLKALWEFGLHPRERGDPDASHDLAVEVFGQTIRNPVATSAGIDKGAEIPDALFAFGAGIVEVGGATPKAQPGNEKPESFA
ncbi:Dihydroorotate dehydrogenase (quinone), mitochondrial [Cyphellophora attinorum]|uniref:Dihydroorotate dehydrogenase (Quinone), mitochondrial n=1 Tax=Cyphellophora attinorum TaxID=1664694 RepID=A0A0N1HFI1_9EURO|nr:Dihydroorotate dehydrogenase (quinone), mitochondrial [Phialophora attinorum]KPI43990.1 Dihydroorotate dehydrogenase (quinone), mitochondrial [Phialophora attinorum]